MSVGAAHVRKNRSNRDQCDRVIITEDPKGIKKSRLYELRHIQVADYRKCIIINTKSVYFYRMGRSTLWHSHFEAAFLLRRNDFGDEQYLHYDKTESQAKTVPSRRL